MVTLVLVIMSANNNPEDTMKKKLLIAFIVIIASLCCALGFAACNFGSGDGGHKGGEQGGRPDHTHEYKDDKIAHTCTEKGYTVHTCYCGESYTDTFVATT